MLPARRPSDSVVAREADRLAAEAAPLFAALRTREIADVWRYVVWATMAAVGAVQDIAAEQIERSWTYPLAPANT